MQPNAITAANSAEFACRVLIVEDEFLIALQLQDILDDHGYRVVGMVADRASLDSIAEAPDVALVDLNLRDGPSGSEIARELSQRFATTVLYVTSDPEQIDVPAPTAVGFVRKPFTTNGIVGAIAFALNKAEGNRPPPDFVPVRAA